MVQSYEISVMGAIQAWKQYRQTYVRTPGFLGAQKMTHRIDRRCASNETVHGEISRQKWKIQKNPLANTTPTNTVWNPRKSDYVRINFTVQSFPSHGKVLFRTSSSNNSWMTMDNFQWEDFFDDTVCILHSNFNVGQFIKTRKYIMACIVV